MTTRIPLAGPLRTTTRPLLRLVTELRPWPCLITPPSSLKSWFPSCHSSEESSSQESFLPRAGSRRLHKRGRMTLLSRVLHLIPDSGGSCDSIWVSFLSLGEGTLGHVTPRLGVPSSLWSSSVEGVVRQSSPFTCGSAGRRKEQRGGQRGSMAAFRSPLKLPVLPFLTASVHRLPNLPGKLGGGKNN